jgi:hypothetical protein
MAKDQHYIVVWNYDSNELENEVNEKLKEGYVLFGDLKVLVTNQGSDEIKDFRFYQAMIKTNPGYGTIGHQP